MLEEMRARARALLESGAVARVLAWEAGEFAHYPTPAFITDPSRLDRMVYDRFCTANLSKYMVDAGEKPGKTMVFLRPCDAHSLAQLEKENQVQRENAYIIGVGCEGCVRVEEGEERGLLESCRACTKADYPVHDELIGAGNNPRTTANPDERFADVIRLDEESPDQRYGFWQNHLSRCIRCNACRNICPTCYCKACVLDSDNPHEKTHFHIIRAYHQAGRCTDCGQCSRVCPQGIPLQLLNRKLIQDAPPL
ncbi:MAG: 4Fe-4S binding protein [Defluviitaleaceae bacterium]|nr:4Fe-4S binding protein [Defluviitaleaceae bacterium]